MHCLTYSTTKQNPLRIEDHPVKPHYQTDASLRNGYGQDRGGMEALRRLKSQNNHVTSKHRVVAGMDLFFTLIQRLSMRAWVRCQAFLNVSGRAGAFARTEHKAQRSRWPLAHSAAPSGQGRGAGEAQPQPPLVSGSTSRLAPSVPAFVTDNFITSQRLETMIQHRTLQVMACVFLFVLI